MYDVPAGRAAQGRFWTLVQRALPDAPALTTPQDIWADWQSPDLFFSQTCGLPFRAKLHGHVALVGTPDPGLKNCPPGYYRSAIVARSDWRGDLAGDFTFAYNEPLSQSGWAAPCTEGIVGSRQFQTGSHAASAQAVLDGRADVASLDALTWQFLQRDWPIATKLRVLQWTQPTPALPFITAPTQDAGRIAKGVKTAINGLHPADKAQLGLFDLVQIPSETYCSLSIPPLPRR